MNRNFLKISALAVSLTIACTVLISTDLSDVTQNNQVEAVSNSVNIEEGTREWDGLEITGGGFVSSIVTGKDVMYARTDVGGAYKYNYNTNEWEQLFGFLSEDDRGLLSVDAIAIDPTDDNTVYMYCGCAYFSGAKSVIYKTTDGGETFTQIDVTDLIQTHANGDGRHFGERLVVDPENPDVLYCGGRTGGLIKSIDGGMTWAYVQGFQELGLFSGNTKWPTWTDNIVNIVDADGTEYKSTNGVSSVAISDGKLVVGVSIMGKTNVFVSEDDGETFVELSADLPTNLYPSRVNIDADGNFLITYVPGLAFASGAGGAYRYNISDGSVDNITPKEGNPYGAVYSDPNNSDNLIATTCGLWYSQLWHEDDWANDAVAWGDITYRSSDGGNTWKQLAPGNEDGWGGPLQANYLQDGGVSWVEGKAIHWSGAIVFDPRDNNRIFVTSGNGIFSSDDIWSDCPTFYFNCNGIEEVVALDMVSVKGGNVYSAIGDYDGFIHYSPTESKQYTPNIGSTSAIAYCPANPDVMVRFSEHQEPAYYSMDAGETWTQMASPGGEGGKASISQLEDGTYRIFHTGKGGASYTDDFGETWNKVDLSGLYYDCIPYMLTDLENPQYVYAYGYFMNPWDATAKPTYKFYVSSDYGKTFSSPTDICTYDQCDAATRIAYIGEGDLILAGGWYGLYHVTDYGKNVEKLDVYYCKTVGYGAPKDETSPNTLYMWGQPTQNDAQGIYASNDCGETWFRVNDDNHSYGGTGNGNFIVGDMNEYGTFYMSTVGVGIVYSRLTDTITPPDETTTTSITVTTPTETTEETDNTTSITIGDSALIGDVNCDGNVKSNDLLLLKKYLLGLSDVTEQGLKNADINHDGNVKSNDLLMLKKFLLGLIEIN